MCESNSMLSGDDDSLMLDTLDEDLEFVASSFAYTCNLQEVDSSKSVLGLKLTKSRTYRSLLEFKLWRAAGDHLGSSHDQPQPMSEDYAVPAQALDNVAQPQLVHQFHHQPMPGKLKASNFEITSIRIGSWKRVSRREGELTAKIYFAKRKLVWEFLDGELKSKIEVPWSGITAIQALTPPNQPGTLHIELDSPPLFYRELKPLPMMHTSWEQVSDFTHGHHASLNRRHHATFPPGALDIHIEKLLQSDTRLLELSRNPFPTEEDQSLLYFNNVVPFHYNMTGGVDEPSIEFQQYSAAYNPTPISVIEAPLPPPPPLDDPIMTTVNFLDLFESSHDHQTQEASSSFVHDSQLWDNIHLRIHDHCMEPALDYDHHVDDHSNNAPPLFNFFR